MSINFADRLHAAISRSGSPACVGLDPVVENIPDQLKAAHSDPISAVREFCRGVVHAVADSVPALKPQSACFERFGAPGVELLEETVQLAVKLGMVVVWDAKRGDIGTTSAHYAAAATRLGAHAVTINGYLGRSGITPFLDRDLGLFVLVRTSNPDSDEFQGLTLADGRSVAHAMADQVASIGAATIGSCGLSSVGAVVGATKSADATSLRERMPNQYFLVPGYGAQGGTAEDIRNMLRPDGTGVLVTASRSVIYAKGAASWDINIREAAKKLATELRAVTQ
ncbi:MAG: orotidine-5'-phosphate decarboxylase [Phycisphaerales bacterium]|jgi:orotidine-5'-phosphate decarboxylase